MDSRRVYDHLLIRDPASAVIEARELVAASPESKEARIAYIRALAENGEEMAVFDEWTKLCSSFREEAQGRTMLESVAWGVLSKAHKSDQLAIQLNGLLGSAFTRDAKAIPLLIDAMRGSNSLLRIVAIRMARFYGDGPLKVELERLLKEEKVWYVRLEVIDTIGALKSLHLREPLKELIANPNTLAEEKAAAILALVQMYDGVTHEEMVQLVKSSRAGLRQLASELVAYFELTSEIKTIRPLLKDASPACRMQAVYTMGLLGMKVDDEFFEDSSPPVAITAAWGAARLGNSEGEKRLLKWLSNPHPEWRRLAAGAIATAGPNLAKLAAQGVRVSDDPYVQATLGIGLLGLRKHVNLATGALNEMLQNRELWMWNEEWPFQFLSPSKLSHIDQIPNYPKVVDQMTRLELLSILAVVEDKKALSTIKTFLKNESWGITGAAAMTLMMEGDIDALKLVSDLLDDPDRHIRIQAALLLAHLGGDTKSIDVLKSAYAEADREMKIRILEALASVSDPTIAPFLIEIFKEPFQMLRVVSASALIQCLNN
jgi:HEAT repeat protein